MRLSASVPVFLGMGNRQSRPWFVSDELWSLVELLLLARLAVQVATRMSYDAGPEPRRPHDVITSPGSFTDSHIRRPGPPPGTSGCAACSHTTPSTS
ncbi:hypothetical protein [Streptomyces olivaceus]|uniref:hypothetical protein n=1 Tax=Streptomyces olivaceus TaxID=47716 RepID=UPI004057B55B